MFKRLDKHPKRSHLEELFESVDPSIWPSLDASIQSAGDRARHASKLNPFLDFEVSPDFEDQWNLLHALGFSHNDLPSKRDWNVLRDAPIRFACSLHHIALAIEFSPDRFVAFWIGPRIAVDGAAERTGAFAILACIVILLSGSILGFSTNNHCATCFDWSLDWFGRSAAVSAFITAILGYLSLSSYQNKAKNAIARGYWLTASRGRKLLDQATLLVASASTLALAFGNLWPIFYDWIGLAVVSLVAIWMVYQIFKNIELHPYVDKPWFLDWIERELDLLGLPFSRRSLVIEDTSTAQRFLHARATVLRDASKPVNRARKATFFRSNSVQPDN